MTAEAFYCRELLQEISGEPIDRQAAVEATKNLLASLPDRDRINLYYWYYAILGIAPTPADERRSGCGLDRVERRAERGSGQHAANPRRERRQLEHEHGLGRLRRPRVYDGDGRHVSGSILPLRADIAHAVDSHTA